MTTTGDQQQWAVELGNSRTRPAPNFPATYKYKPNAEADAAFATFDSTTSPGCAAAVAKHGKLIYSRGYGMANLGSSSFSIDLDQRAAAQEMLHSLMDDVVANKCTMHRRLFGCLRP